MIEFAEFLFFWITKKVLKILTLFGVQTLKKLPDGPKKTSNFLASGRNNWTWKIPTQSFVETENELFSWSQNNATYN